MSEIAGASSGEDKEREHAAKSGLKLLEEHKELRRLLEEKEEELEASKAQLDNSQAVRRKMIFFIYIFFSNLQDIFSNKVILH